MSSIGRLFRELRKPALKCERVGHLIRIRNQRGIMSTGNHRMAIADNVQRECQYCARCHTQLTDWKVTDRSWISSLSMPDEHWSILRMDGIYITHDWFEVRATPQHTGKP